MKLLFVIICIYFLASCKSGGLLRGTIQEQDVKADEWDRKDLVITVQESLTELGYKAGEIDGSESSQTLQAVKQYRIDHGLAINTVIDGHLEKHINSFLWKTRHEQSVDTAASAKAIVQNRHREECKRLLGGNFQDIPFPKNQSTNAEIYL